MLRIFLFLALSFPAFAHPHVFFENAAVIVMNEASEVRAIKHSWRFDKLQSEAILKDLKQEGEMNEERYKAYAKMVLEGLEEYDYYTHAKRGNVKLAFEKPEDFNAKVVNDQIELNFTLPLRSPPKIQGNTFSLDIYDISMFSHFTPQNGEFIKLENAPKTCKSDYKTPEKGSTSALEKLGEMFFENMGVGNSIAKQYSGSFQVKCS